VFNWAQVNLSIAIIPLSHQFGWNSSTAGLVQSSFFWGYALSQLPGGWLAKIFGGRLVTICITSFFYVIFLFKVGFLLFKDFPILCLDSRNLVRDRAHLQKYSNLVVI
jgi:ACS family sodium-dependent inorganic phosphate cotransporter